MASESQLKVEQNYDGAIKAQGITDTVIERYVQFVQSAFGEEDINYALYLAEKVKGIINEKIKSVTSGGDFYWLEPQMYGKEHPLIFWYYDVLKEEAPYKFDSYLLYLERKRREKDRFYSPKREVLLKHGLIQAMQDLEDDKLDLLSISMPPGTQKCQPLYSKVLTPDGFITMGEVCVGTKVIAGNGKVATVISESETKKRPIYEVTFDDGSKTRCSDNHIWHVQTRDDRRRGNKYRDIELKQMLGNIKVEDGKRKNYSIDYVGRIEFSEKNYVIAPYVMGVILGDGGISAGSIVIATEDKQILDNMKLFMPYEYEFVRKNKYDYLLKTNVYYTRSKSKYRKALEGYKLWGCKSDNKFIPREYLLGSYEQRLWLLRGLMDTDGSVGLKNGDCSYCTISKQLAEDVIELVHSLGGYASLSIRPSGYKDKNGNYIKCSDTYNLYIRLRNNSDLFALDRKKDRCFKKRLGEKRFIEKIEYIGEEDCKCILIDDPCHLYITDDYIITHNTTLEKFFCSWIIGKHPDDYSLFFSHSGDITRMFYDGVLDITTSAEYCWGEIFQVPLQATNAKAETINFGKYKPFASIQCTSVGSKNAGKVRCNRYLYCDDLIGGIEEALNKTLLDKLWNIYSVDARQRKLNEQVKEIHIATRWSVHDVIGRLKNAFETSDRARFIAVPDLDPQTGESNFKYKFNGMSKEFFEAQALLMDEISYKCLYKNEPIEREGLLYHDADLRRYLDIPSREPDAIVGVCDTKSKGIDFMVLPCLYVYGDDHYLVDVVCNNSSDYNLQEERLTNIICEHEMQRAEFESNAGGDRLAANVAAKVKERGGRCSITTKPTETNKETRIIVNSNWVKEHVLFKDSSLYTRKSEYGEFMNQLLSYSVSGKNPHDDVPDAMANYALFATKPERKVARIMHGFL